MPVDSGSAIPDARTIPVLCLLDVPDLGALLKGSVTLALRVLEDKSCDDIIAVTDILEISSFRAIVFEVSRIEATCALTPCLGQGHLALQTHADISPPKLNDLFCSYSSLNRRPLSSNRTLCSVSTTQENTTSRSLRKFDELHTGNTDPQRNRLFLQSTTNSSRQVPRFQVKQETLLGFHCSRTHNEPLQKKFRRIKKRIRQIDGLRNPLQLAPICTLLDPLSAAVVSNLRLSSSWLEFRLL